MFLKLSNINLWATQSHNNQFVFPIIDYIDENKHDSSNFHLNAKVCENVFDYAKKPAISWKSNQLGDISNQNTNYFNINSSIWYKYWNKLSIELSERKINISTIFILNDTNSIIALQIVSINNIECEHSTESSLYQK